MKKKWTKKAEPKLCFFFLLLNSKTLIELINSTLSSCCLLVSCVERMALGTNFHVNFRLCGTCYEGVSTVAGYGCLMVTWMNVFSHIFPLSAWFPTMRIRLSVIGLLGFHKAKCFSWNTIPQKRERRKRGISKCRVFPRARATYNAKPFALRFEEKHFLIFPFFWNPLNFLNYLSIE